MTFLLVAHGGLVLAGAPNPGAVRERSSTGEGIVADGSREFAAGPGQTLVLDLRAGGRVEVTGTSGDVVRVTWHSMAGVPAPALRVDQTADGVRVSGELVDGGKSYISAVAVSISVPRRFDVRVDALYGELRLADLEGTFAGTLGGALSLEGVRGESNLSTSGAVAVRNSDLNGALQTAAGDVVFENVVGDVVAASATGTVDYGNVRRHTSTSVAPRADQ